MKITESVIRRIVREALLNLSPDQVDDAKVLKFADEYFMLFVRSQARRDDIKHLEENLGDSLDDIQAKIISGIADAFKKVLSGVRIKPATEELVDDVLGEFIESEKIDMSNEGSQKTRDILLLIVDDILSNLMSNKSEPSKGESLSVSLVAAGGEKKTQGIQYNKNVEEIQKIIGTTPDGKWGSNTQEAFKVWLNSKTSVTIDGASKEEIIESWKRSAPKITRVGGKQMSFTGNASGLLSFVKAINAAVDGAVTPPPVTPDNPGDNPGYPAF